jgi:hypothetical protein
MFQLMPFHRMLLISMAPMKNFNTNFAVAKKEGDVFGSSNLAVVWEKERGIYSLSKFRSSKAGA